MESPSEEEVEEEYNILHSDLSLRYNNRHYDNNIFTIVLVHVHVLVIYCIAIPCTLLLLLSCCGWVAKWYINKLFWARRLREA